jgi:hypothetical protein
VRFTPASPERLVDLLADSARSLIGTHPVRVALDGPELAQLGSLADDLAVRMRRSGTLVAVIRAAGFYRDASLRFEYGKTDVDSFYAQWLDRRTLQAEVLIPLGPGGSGRYLPSLRDPISNRSTRAVSVALAPDAVAVVVGELLLGAGLSFDLTIHAVVSEQARRRRERPERRWTLPAFARYEREVDPAAAADIVVRYDDPAHPAVAVNRSPPSTGSQPRLD